MTVRQLVKDSEQGVAGFKWSGAQSLVKLPRVVVWKPVDRAARLDESGSSEATLAVLPSKSSRKHGSGHRNLWS